MKWWNTCKKQNQKNPKWFFCSSCMTFISQYHWHFTFNGAPMWLSWRNGNLFSQFPMYHCLKNKTKKQPLWKHTVNTEPESNHAKSALSLDRQFIILINHCKSSHFISSCKHIDHSSVSGMNVFCPHGVFSSPDCCWQTAVLCSCWQQRDSRGSCVCSVRLALG